MSRPHETCARDEMPMRVMVLSSDRRFCEVASLLLERRGCAVSLGDGAGTLAQRVDRERTDVIVIDACRSLAAAARTRAAVDALSRRVGVVIVGDQAQGELPGLRTIAKWGPFELLFEAVERAYREQADGPALLARRTERAESEPSEPLDAEPLSA